MSVRKAALGALSFLAILLFYASCEKNDPVIPNEEEVITTLIYTLTPDGGGTPVVLNFQDLDGDGGDPPIIMDGALAVNQTYTGVLELRNEQETPSEDITSEIQAEAEDHQFFFQSDVPGLSITYADQDADGNPVGLQTTVTTSTAGEGTLTIVLRHEPDKAADGVANGELDRAGGETDIEVTFAVDVE